MLRYTMPIVLFVIVLSLSAEESPNIAAQLAAAKSGDTVVVPAGVFKIGKLVVPEGVTLKGSGFDQTTLCASNLDGGLVLKDSAGAVVSDLTIQGATVAGIHVTGRGPVTITRVRSLHNLCGINVQNGEKVRIENCIMADNRNGVTFSGVTDSVLVNCTLVNRAVGLSFSACKRVNAFNNLISESDLGIYLPQNNEDLHCDNNLWSCMVIGKLEGEYPRRSVVAWSALSGLERHSVMLPVTFSNPARGEYWPVSTLTWRPAAATTSGWGVAEFAGAKAPAIDIRGTARTGDPDVGAYATGRIASPPPDGKLSIASSDGVKSAGVFRKDGTLVCYLFQSLPLHQGEHEFWLPSRDFLMRPIESGNYEVRMAEGQVSGEMLGYVANEGIENYGVNANEMHLQLIEYADDGRLIRGNGWSERGINISDVKPEKGDSTWSIGGCGEMDGLTVGNNGLAYALKAGKNTIELIQFDSTIGEAKPWPDNDYKRYYPEIRHDSYKSRLAFLNGRLYLADGEKNLVYFGSASAPEFKESFNAPAPDAPAGDEKNGLLWLISEGKSLIAYDEKGDVKQRFEGVPRPVALSIRNGRMAIASAQTGKVHVFDCNDPAALKPLLTIGTGEDPVGPVQPDRFEFKTSELGWKCPRVDVAVGPKGEVAVQHNGRVAMFDAAGKLVRDQWSEFCWDMYPMNFGDGQPTIFVNGQGVSFQLDAKSKSWKPHANWGYPENVVLKKFFSMNGKKYGVGIRVNKKQYANGIDGTEGVICRLDRFAAHIVAQYFCDNDSNWSLRRAAGAEGVVTGAEEARPWTTAEGIPVRAPYYFFGYSYPDRDGSMRLIHQGDHMASGPWPDQKENRAIVIDIEADSNGLPVLALHKDHAILMRDTEIPSPFELAQTQKLTRLGGLNGAVHAPDGGIAMMPYLETSPAMKGNMVNGSGSDVAGFSADGRLRWLRTLTEAGPIISLSSMQGLLIAGSCNETELYTMTADGLSVGNVALPLSAHYRFGLMDHPNVFQPFIGNDGKPYYLMGEFMSNCANWFALRNTDNIRHSVAPLNVDPSRAASLRLMPIAVSGRSAAQPARITIRKLPAPMTIDGDMAKWRNSGITPQVIITPDTGNGIKGPTDASVVIRAAWEGDNLYVQAIKFDNKVVMYQSADKFYLQDCLEMSINGYLAGGFKYNVTRVRNKGDVIFRDRWFGEKDNLNRFLEGETAQCKIVVLDNAKDVEERKLIEGLYGVDLTNSPVIVTEFKLTMSEAYNKDQSFNKSAGLPEAPVMMKSGGVLHLGFMIDDSDQLGGDVQNYIGWPASYNTWVPAELHAEAVLE